MKHFRTAGILTVVLGVLSGIAYWDEWKTKKDADADIEKNKLVSFAPETVTSIDYLSTEGVDQEKVEHFKLSKANGTWSVVEPVATKAQGTAVDSLLTSLAGYKYTKIVGEDKASWSKFGLEKPMRTISLTFGDGKGAQTKTIYLGDKGAVGYNAYSRTSESDKAYIGSQVILTETAKTLSDFRDKALVEFNRDNVSKITLTKANTNVAVIAKDKESYRLVSPIAAVADSGSVVDFLEDLKAIKITEFIDAPSAKQVAMFTGNPKGDHFSVTLENADGSSLKLLAVRDQEGFFASFNPQKLIFKLESSDGDRFDKTVFDFQNRRIVTFEASEVEEVQADGETYDKVDGDWYTATDANLARDKKSKAKPTPKAQIQSLVIDLAQAKAADLVKADRWKKVLAQAPLHRLKIKSLKDEKPSEVTLDAWKNPDNEGKYLVRVTGREDIFLVDKSTFASLDGPEDLGL